MSDSIPEKPTSNNEEALTLSDRATRMSRRDWIFSIVIHLVIAGIIIWVIPPSDPQSPNSTENSAAPQTQSSPKQPESRILKDPEKIQEVAEQIEKTQSEKAGEKVAELLETEEKISELAKERLDAYEKIKSENVAEALKSIEEKQKKLVEEKMQASEKIQSLEEVLSKLDKTISPEALRNLLEQSIEEIEKLQRSIEQKQRSIQNEQISATKLTETDSPENASKQKEASDDQKQVSQAQEDEINAQEKIFSDALEWAKSAAQSHDLNQEIQDLKKEIERMDREVLPPAKKELDESTERLNKAKQQLQSAQAKTSQSAKQVNSSDVEQAAKKQEEAQRIQEEKLQNHDQAAQLLQSKRDQLKEREESQKNLQSKLAEKSPSTLAKQISQAKNSQNQAVQSQKEAARKQSDVVQDILTKKKSPSENKSSAAPKTESILAKKNLAELYDEAQASELRIAEQYKMLRATELALIRQIPLKEALQATQVAKMEREKLDRTLLENKGANESLEGFKKQVLKADQQINAMLTASKQLLSVAKEQKNLGSGDIQVGEWLKNQKIKTDIIEKQALADKKFAGKDMSALMKGGMSTQGARDDLYAHHGGTKPSEYGSMATEYIRNAPELPYMDHTKVTSFPARRFSSKGTQSSEWFHIDSWYVIGPFPNQNREHLHTKFPPELMIDLDAVYPGKDGKPVRWQFVQWDQARLRFPNDVENSPCIYYAYTELFFDEDRDMWLASGSDDKGNMWINNLMVWDSGDSLKAWRANEAYRKVHFVKGRNKILYRVENGIHIAVMSLMISSKQQ